MQTYICTHIDDNTCVCMYTFIRLYMYIHIHIYIYIYIYTYMCTNIYIYICTYIYICMYIYVYIYGYTYIYIHIDVHIYMYIHVYICTRMLYIYMYIGICNRVRDDSHQEPCHQVCHDPPRMPSLTFATTCAAAATASLDVDVRSSPRVMPLLLGGRCGASTDVRAGKGDS